MPNDSGSDIERPATDIAACSARAPSINVHVGSDIGAFNRTHSGGDPDASRARWPGYAAGGRARCQSLDIASGRDGAARRSGR